MIFARPDAYDLADWVRNEASLELVHPFDSLDRWSFEIEGDLDQVDVLVVLGLDKTPADIAAGRPVLFGDQVIMSALNVLDRRGYLVNAEVSRPFSSLAFDVVTVVPALDPDVLVLHVGNDGPIGRRELQDLLEGTSHVPNVILVNTHVDREWAAANNALLAEVDEPGDNLILMDWDALADLCPGDCFADDGIHLTDVGAEYFAETLSEITGL